MTSAYPRRGHLYWAVDKEIQLPSTEPRKLHKQRPVVIFSGSDTALDSAWPNVLVIPCSTAFDWNTPFCVEIEQGQGNAPEQTWARVPLIQPLLKIKLGNWLGKSLPNELITKLELSLMRYLGVAFEDEE